MKLNFLLAVLMAFSFVAVSDEAVNAKKTYDFNGSKHNKSQNKRTVKQKAKFKCDKRQYCSQMTSYEEALFFIKHCPNVKMDGDNDGIPCERQFKKG